MGERQIDYEKIINKYCELTNNIEFKQKLIRFSKKLRFFLWLYEKEFIKNKNILLSREYLLEKVWQDSFDKQEKTVNVAIKRLKDKIDPNSKKNYIKSVRGEGYIFC
mgnify:CR=1 FL=1